MNFKPCYQYTMKTFERLAKRIEKDCGIKLEQSINTNPLKANPNEIQSNINSGYP